MSVPIKLSRTSHQPAMKLHRLPEILFGQRVVDRQYSETQELARKLVVVSQLLLLCCHITSATVAIPSASVALDIFKRCPITRFTFAHQRESVGTGNLSCDYTGIMYTSCTRTSHFKI